MTVDQHILRSYTAMASRKQPRTLEALALRTRSIKIRELLAHLATNGSETYDPLLARIRNLSQDPAPGLSQLSPTWGPVLARVVALQELTKEDPANALAIFEALERDYDIDAFTPVAQQLYFELLFDHEHYVRARALLDRATAIPAETARLLAIDLSNPFVPQLDGDFHSWSTKLGAVHESAGFAATALRPKGPTPFDRLTAPPLGRSIDGPLVTVILPTHRPGPHLDTAVRSILQQSWRNLELIIVDDSASPDQQSVLADYNRFDRTRVIHQKANGGTYLARNAGLDAARGEFVTFQDSDDWSHPQRIELQVQALLDDPHLLATQSLCHRVTPNLLFHTAGYQLQRLNTSSLLFRREAVLSKIGYFDTTRKAADTEYQMRLKAAFGQPVQEVKLPLAFVRFEPGSLSRRDFRPGWHHESRTAYREAYSHWHRHVSEKRVAAYLPAVSTTRPFPAPSAFLKDLPGASTSSAHYDVIFLNDWTRSCGRHVCAIAETQALTSHGYRVGIAQIETAASMRQHRKPICREIQALINSGEVDRVLLDQQCKTRTLIVRDAAILQFPPHVDKAWQCDRVYIFADTPPQTHDNSRWRYAPHDCARNAQEYFGITPDWAPSDSHIRTALEGSAISFNLMPIDAPLIVQAEALRVTRRRFRSSRPVIGTRTGGREIDEHSSIEYISAIYPPEFDIRIIGGAEAFSSPFDGQGLPAHWINYSERQLSQRAFLAQIDFFAGFGSTGEGVLPVRTIVEAMAAGCVVVLPYDLRSTFDSGAVYCEPSRIRDLISDFYADWERYRIQSQRAVNSAQANYGNEGYLDRLARLGAI